MKVLENNEKNTVDFAELKPGDCFWWKGHLFIKSNFAQHAVEFSDGRTIMCMCGVIVTPVNAVVQIID